jgi:hypothetical protein
MGIRVNESTELEDVVDIVKTVMEVSHTARSGSNTIADTQTTTP